MRKSELQEIAAILLNLTNDVDKEQWSNDQLGQLHTAIAMLPPSIHEDWANNGTIMPKDLA